MGFIDGMKEDVSGLFVDSANSQLANICDQIVLLYMISTVCQREMSKSYLSCTLRKILFMFASSLLAITIIGCLESYGIYQIAYEFYSEKNNFMGIDKPLAMKLSLYTRLDKLINKYFIDKIVRVKKILGVIEI